MNRRRKLTASVIALLASAFVTAGALAQAGAFPARTIKLVVPFAAGGSSDILARVVAEKAGALLGQAIVIDNRAGGNTVIGTQAVASASPDGYTLLQASPNTVVVAALQKNLPYNLERDFRPIIGIGAVPLLVAVPASASIRSIADLVTAAKQPAGISYASGGIGSLGHLAPARFLRELKITATHVPYRGVAPAIQDVAANRVQLMFVSSLEGMQMVKSGGIRLLGVTAEQRLPGLPDVPTMAELGFAGFTPAVWYGFLAPAKTPAPVVARLYTALEQAMGDASVQSRLGELGLTVKVRNGADFGTFMREEAERWRAVVVENNIKLE
jgi:tripartite-type tricarboxylate transporter receptor subunit TctC